MMLFPGDLHYFIYFPNVGICSLVWYVLKSDFYFYVIIQKEQQQMDSISFLLRQEPFLQASQFNQLF